MDNQLIFLNNSVNKKSEDAIGYDTYVNKLNDAIDSGAKMIAVTSPFGSGKTTIIDLLLEKRCDNKNEKLLKIPMWSQLNNLSNDSTNSIQLHKNFLYQISSSIDKRKGTYISRMLSGNYGLLKLHVNKIRYWVTTVIALTLAFISFLLEKYSDNIITFFPFIDRIPEFISPLLLVLAILFLVITVTCTEILFSSKNSESKRVISSDEIIDLYRNEIISYKGKKYSAFTVSLRKSKIYNTLSKCKLNKKIHKNKFMDKLLNKLKEKTYIIVIEDLDRSNDGNAVINFLTELRKYYIPDINNERIHNNIVFIVNIKPETMLFEELPNNTKEESITEQVEQNPNSETSEETIANANPQKLIFTKNETNSTECNVKIKDLYAKLFDFVLDLQTININDYETVLNNILLKHKPYFSNKKIYKDEEKLSKIPGMQWIIRGKKLDIREIKHRLNRAIIIYETLLSRFPDKAPEINFEKCAVASYLMCAYEAEFNKTADDLFDTLVELNIQNELPDFNKVKENLNTENENYAKDVYSLVTAKLITSDYRMYFYNYPKGSDIYSNDENAIINAILYDEYSDNLNELTEKVLKSRPEVIKKTFEKFSDLQLSLPKSVINTENLFLYAVQNSIEAILAYFNSMNVTDDSIDKTINTITTIMEYDQKRLVYTEEIIASFLNCWEKKLEEKHIVKLREALCQNFPNEISFYKELFFNTHNIISIKEINLLPLRECINLTNKGSVNFSPNHVSSITTKFTNLKDFFDEDVNVVQSFLISSSQVLDPISIVDCYFEYMKHINKIIPDLAYVIFKIIETPPTSSEEIESETNSEKSEDTFGLMISVEVQKEIFNKYLQLINNTSLTNIPDCVFEQINTLGKFENRYDYTEQIANKLYDIGYRLTYILIACTQKYKINFSDSNIYEAIKKNEDWLEENLDDFTLIRKKIITEANNLSTYSFLFTSRFPIISNAELIDITRRHDIDPTNIMNYIPFDTVNEDIIATLCKYLNQKTINNNIACDILLKITSWTKDHIKLFFGKINFATSIQYYKFAKDKKTLLKRQYKDIFELETIDGILDFMEYTRYLDESLEKKLTQKCNNEQEQRYGDIIRSRLGSTNKTTINNIISFKYYRGFDNEITQYFFDQKNYEWYVVSKIMYHNKFTLEKEDVLNIIWPVYIDIYLEKTRLASIRRYMEVNEEFLEEIQKRKNYADFQDEDLAPLSKILQDELLVQEIFSRDNDFIISYFANFKGFKDHAAAKKFIELLESHETVIYSDEVKTEVYDKLIDPSLKGRYTRLRNMYNLSN